LVEFGRADIVDRFGCGGCFWLTTSWRAGHDLSSEMVPSKTAILRARGARLFGDVA
jgi:hypothetical protein